MTKELVGKTFIFKHLAVSYQYERPLSRSVVSSPVTPLSLSPSIKLNQIKRTFRIV